MWPDTAWPINNWPSGMWPDCDSLLVEPLTNSSCYQTILINLGNLSLLNPIDFTNSISGYIDLNNRSSLDIDLLNKNDITIDLINHNIFETDFPNLFTYDTSLANIAIFDTDLDTSAVSVAAGSFSYGPQDQYVYSYAYPSGTTIQFSTDLIKIISLDVNFLNNDAITIDLVNNIVEDVDYCDFCEDCNNG